MRESPEGTQPEKAFYNTLDQILGIERDVDWFNGRSRRYLRQAEGFNISLHNTTCHAGKNMHNLVKYQGTTNHLSSSWALQMCFCPCAITTPESYCRKDWLYTLNTVSEKSSPLQYRNNKEACYYFEGPIEYTWDNGKQSHEFYQVFLRLTIFRGNVFNPWAPWRILYIFQLHFAKLIILDS